MPGLYSATKYLGQTEQLKDSMELSFKILLEVGEKLPRPMGGELKEEIRRVNNILQNTPDDQILSMNQISDPKIATLLKLYSNLAHVLHFTEPSLIASVSLRMVDLTVKTGLTPISPLAFALVRTFYCDSIFI